MKLSKKLGRIVLLYMTVVMLCIPSISVHAEVAVTELSTLMATQNAVDALAEPSEESEVVFSYEKDSHILVTGETTTGWYRVAYQDKVGYVRKSDLKETELNMAGLDEEFAANELEDKLFIEEVERVRAQISRSRIWGTIIILIIVGIFGTGVYSTIMSDKKKKQDEQDSDAAQPATENVEQQPTNENVEVVVETEPKEWEESHVVANALMEDVEEQIEPLSFDKKVEMPELDIIDLDKQEL